jgi:MFS transporter, putative metabolite:H+ symporter
MAIQSETGGSAISARVKFTILVAALGYLVDVFDLILYTLLRNQSLTDMGVPAAQLKSVGATLLYWQMSGFIVGGLLWGVIGDKRGRLSTLLGSIVVYSLANIANGFVQDTHTYAVLRFVSGVGLAGEIGAGVALASELLPQRLRGLGTTFISVLGLLGAIFAVLVVDHLGWRSAYWVGGGLGLLLLVMRVSVVESGMFNRLKDSGRSQGDLLKFLSKPALVGRLLLITLVGTPIWFVIGTLVTFTPEISRSMGITTLKGTSQAVLCVYIGLGLGGIVTGLLSQKLQSRKKVIGIWLAMSLVAILVFGRIGGTSATVYIGMIGVLGFSAGYWNMFLQIAAEQFGTNYRSTAAGSAPNLVRGMTIPMNMAFTALSASMTDIRAATMVGICALLVGTLAWLMMTETFHRDLDFVEPI